MAGRPSKLTPELSAAIIKVLEIGVDFDDACAYVGIDYSTFARWREIGKEAKSGTLFDFNVAVEKAISTASVNHQANIASAAAKGDWKASLEWLRRHRATWKDTSAVDLSNADGSLSWAKFIQDKNAGKPESDNQ